MTPASAQKMERRKRENKGRGRKTSHGK